MCCVHCEDFHRHKFRCNFTADRALRGDLRALTFEHAMETRPRTLNHAVLVFLLYFINGGFSSAQNGIPDGAGSLVFVFDTTGSMYDDLIQVRAGASKILSTTLERKVKPLYNYVLIPFHDPGKSRDQCKLFLIPNQMRSSLCTVRLCFRVFSVSYPLFTLMKDKQKVAGGRRE